MNTEELKRLAQAEMALRGSLDQEAVQKWCDTLRDLRQAVPDWCVAALELIAENERLLAEAQSALAGHMHIFNERDLLKTENERLNAAVKDALNKKALADQAVIEISAERDQVQDENERLKAALEEALPYTNDVAHDPEVWLRLSSVMVKEARS